MTSTPQGEESLLKGENVPATATSQPKVVRTIPESLPAAGVISLLTFLAASGAPARQDDQETSGAQGEVVDGTSNSMT